MGWKRKEKELTREEALALAKEAAQPFWIESPPLFTALEQPDGTITVHPLQDSFTNEIWILLATDLTQASGKNSVDTAEKWAKRYKSFGIRTLIVFVPPASFASDRAFVSNLMSAYESELPVVIDANHGIHRVFSSSGGPASIPVPYGVYLEKGVPVFMGSASGINDDWEPGFELKLQNRLRESDAGLPLSPPLVPDPGRWMDRGNVNFSADPDQQKILKKKLQLAVTGEWDRADDHWSTSDPSATITFSCPSSGFSLISKWMVRTVESARIFIEVEGAPAYENFAGANLRFDEGGQSFVDAKDLSIQQALISLPKDARRITLRFSTAKRTPVALMGFRFFGAKNEL